MKKVIVRAFECLVLACSVTACASAPSKAIGETVPKSVSIATSDPVAARTPLPKQAAASELWSRILALANLPGGYITRADFEREFGERAEGERSEEKPYTISFSQLPTRDYDIFVRVEPLTRIPFNSAASSRLINTTPSSTLHLVWLGPDCLGLQKVRDDLASIGIVLNEWVQLPASLGAPPMPPGGYFYKPGGKEFVKIAVSQSSQSNFNPNEAPQWAKACVSSINIEGYKKAGATD